jgi:hypothetical protein
MALIASFLPIILSLVKWILDKKGADEATKKAFLDLISAAKMDPAICLRMKDDFKSSEDELKRGGGQ